MPVPLLMLHISNATETSLCNVLICTSAAVRGIRLQAVRTVQITCLGSAG